MSSLRVDPTSTSAQQMFTDQVLDQNLLSQRRTTFAAKLRLACTGVEKEPTQTVRITPPPQRPKLVFVKGQKQSWIFSTSVNPLCCKNTIKLL